MDAFYLGLLSFVMDFKDPATLYIESLINVHNNVMWYLVLILTLVYWILYVIIKDSQWNSFNRVSNLNEDFFILVTNFGLKLHTLFSIVFHPIFFSIIDRFDFNFLIRAILKSELSGIAMEPELLNYFKWFGTMEHISLFLRPKVWRNQDMFSDIDGSLAPTDEDIFVSMVADYALWNVTNRGYFFFGKKGSFDSLISFKYSPFLTVQRFKHSTLLEVIWATFPSIIILLILVPSILLIYSIDENIDPEYTIKVIGHQWFWSYEFDGWVHSDSTYRWLPGTASSICPLDPLNPSLASFEYDSCMIVTDDLQLGQHRLLEVDNPLVVPCSIGIRFLITSTDVLHSWAIPQLGIKVDAVPGRLSQYITMIRRPGVFYGQCSEICGIAHGFMPIVVIGELSHI